MAARARNKFGIPMFESKVFREQIYCIKKVLATLLRLFGAPRDSVPGGLSPISPIGAPMAKCVLD